MDEENWVEFSNIIKMDDENIEKFKKLYGEGERFFIANTTLCETKISFSQIIPEVQKNESDKEWFDNSRQDASNFFGAENSELIGKTLAKWRIDHWGSCSDLLYDDGPHLQTLEGLLKGEYVFFTRCRPPIKVYEKMATDGLVFEAEWWSRASDEWAIGKGQVKEGRFLYDIGPMTGSEKMSLELVAHEFLEPEESSDDRPTIVVKSREHLDQLIQCVQEYLKTELYLQGTFGLIREILGNTIVLDNVLDLNFIDVSSVTDLSDLFANFDVSPCPEKGWFCKIRLDISKWNVSSETKMTHLFDNDRVDLGDFRKWDTSRANKVWDDIESYYNFGFNIILNFKDKHSLKTSFDANDEDFLDELSLHNIPSSDSYYRNGKLVYDSQPEDSSEDSKTAPADDGAEDDLPF